MTSRHNLLIIGLLLIGSNLFGQARIRLEPGIFYNEEINTSSDSIPVTLVFRNTGDRVYDGPLGCVYFRKGDSSRLADTVFFDAKTRYNILADSTERLIKYLHYNTVLFGRGGNFAFLPVAPGAPIDTTYDSVEVVQVVNGKANLEITDISAPAFARFGDKISLQVNLANSGNIDYLSDSIKLFTSINNDTAFEQSVPNVLGLANEANTIPVTIDIGINNQFVKGDGNIIIVWPVGLDIKPDSNSHPITIDWPAGLPEQNNVSLYPNPARRNSLIHLPEGFELVRIVDMQGHVVLSDKSGKHTTQISLIKPGTYLLELRNKQTTIRVPVIIGP